MGLRKGKNTKRLRLAIRNGIEGKNTGLRTGNAIYDKITKGVKKGEYVLYFGDTGSGKSSFLVDLAYRLLIHEKKDNIYLYYFNIEMREEDLLARFMSRNIYEDQKKVFSVNKILSKDFDNVLTEHDFKNHVEKSIDWLDTVEDRLTVYSKTVSAEFFQQDLDKIALLHGKYDKETGKYVENNTDDYVVIFFDLLNNVNPQDKKSMDYVSKLFYEYRNKCNFSCHLLQQAGRDFKSTMRRAQNSSHFQLDDGKDTNNPVQDADMVVGIFYPLRENIQTHNGYSIFTIENGVKMQVFGDFFRDTQVLKNRNGMSNIDIPMLFHGEINRFIELDRYNIANNYSSTLIKL